VAFDAKSSTAIYLPGSLFILFVAILDADHQNKEIVVLLCIKSRLYSLFGTYNKQLDYCQV